MKNPIFQDPQNLYYAKRGGSWYYYDVFASVSDPSESSQAYKSHHMGFRLFRSLK